MFDKLEATDFRYEELNQLVSDPAVIADNQKWTQLCIELSEITPLIMKFREYKKLREDIDGARDMQALETDKEFKELLRLEIEENSKKMEQVADELKVLLLPKDVDDDKNVIMEIRAGTGGEEAALFAASLFRMYAMYADNHKLKVEIMDENSTELGGYKEIVFSVSGKGAYSKLRFESGVHRVQRVPETEAGGRIHTSAVTVAVLPEAQDMDVEINTNDLRIDVYRASGAGGQHINKTESAVRITHLPTGFVVACQSERSQFQNKDTAMKILRSKLYDYLCQQQDAELAKARKDQVGSGDRSERIRTYNYPQGRVTDHRINLTLYKIDAILNGAVDELIEALSIDRQTKLLRQEETE